MHYNEVLSNRLLITDYCTENDLKKKETLLNSIYSIIGPNIDLFGFVQLLNETQVRSSKPSYITLLELSKLYHYL
jgi:hypothetical protein